MAPSAVNEPSKQQPVRAKAGENPLRAISHGDLMPGIPTFPTFAAERRHTLVNMAALFRSWSRQGFIEGAAGHMSVRDPEFPGLMWMNPLARHFGLLTAGDMICLDIASGRVVAGRKNPATGGITSNTAGYYIHAAVHKTRPDIHAACHSHTISGRAWSVFGRPLDMLTQDSCFFHNAHSVYSSYGGIVFAADEADRIAAALGSSNKGLIMMNHGLLTVGSTINEAAWRFGLLDRMCEIQLKVEAAAAGNSGLKKNIITEEEAAHAFKMASGDDSMYREGQIEVEYEIEVAGGEDVMARGFDELVVDPEATVA